MKISSDIYLPIITLIVGALIPLFTQKKQFEYQLKIENTKWKKENEQAQLKAIAEILKFISFKEIIVYEIQTTYLDETIYDLFRNYVFDRLYILDAEAANTFLELDREYVWYQNKLGEDYYDGKEALRIKDELTIISEIESFEAILKNTLVKTS